MDAMRYATLMIIRVYNSYIINRRIPYVCYLLFYKKICHCNDVCYNVIFLKSLHDIMPYHFLSSFVMILF